MNIGTLNELESTVRYLRHRAKGVRKVNEDIVLSSELPIGFAMGMEEAANLIENALKGQLFLTGDEPWIEGIKNDNSN